MFDNQLRIRWVQLWRQNDWGQYLRRNEVFTCEIAKHPTTCEILHIEEVSLRRALFWVVKALKGDRIGRLHARKIYRWRPVTISEKIKIISMLTIGGSRFRIFHNVNKLLLAFQIRLRVPQHSNTIILAYPPGLLIDVAPSILKHGSLIVDLVDDVAAREKNLSRRSYFLKSYKRVLSRSAKNIATHESLKVYDALAKQAIEVFPNGVNMVDFDIATDFCSVKEDINSSQIVGYVGSINFEFDETLVITCLENFPNTLFHFYGFLTGEGKRKVDRMSQYPNFKFFGPLFYEKVPKFLIHCSVLLLPKYANQCTQGGDSMKIYQYLATGRPIVSTRVSPSPNYPELIYLADSPEEYKRALDQALAERSSEKIRLRREVALAHSWSDKIENFVSEAISNMDQSNQN